MRIDYADYSGCGGRPVNEDSRLCMENCFVVADGLGGHDNGETASAAAVDYFRTNFRGACSKEETARLLSGADEAVRTNGDGGKSTLAALFVNGTSITYANIGDSRVYYFRNGSIFARSRDHSVCQASVEMGDMKEVDMRGSDDRSGLFKVLGGETPVKLPKPYEPIEAQNGDAFLICSDGFWEYVYEMEMEADLLKSANAQEWLRHMLKRQLLRAHDSGDNYTAICGIISMPEKPIKKKPTMLPVLLVCLGLSLAGLGAYIAMKTLPAGNPAPDETGTVTSDVSDEENSAVTTDAYPIDPAVTSGTSPESTPAVTTEEAPESTSQSSQTSEGEPAVSAPEDSPKTAEAESKPAEETVPPATTPQPVEETEPPITTTVPAETSIPDIPTEHTIEAVVENFDR